MQDFLKKYLPNKKKEVVLVAIQFIIIILHFINFLDLELVSFYSSNIYKNLFGTLIIIIGILGFVLSFKDLGKNISPFPTPLKKGSLVTFGIYRWISHPMYYSTTLISIGLFLRYLNLFNLFLTLCLIFIFKFKIQIEENYLRRKYKNYQIYKNNLKI